MLGFLRKYGNFVYIFLIFLSLLPYITPPAALFAGIIFALIFNQPYPDFNKQASKYLLQFSVVGLGFGMNLHSALASGRDGLLFTVISVGAVMLAGWFIGKKLKVAKTTSYLISTGTAICGGSAIAAVAPVIKARSSEISVALGTIFMLNAAALFIFPPLGHLLGLTQEQFGLWAAIAIHDTSSVVGAGSAYGAKALDVATTVKLTRALWIIPLVFVTSLIFKHKTEKVYMPWFILFFVIAMIINTFIDLPKAFLKTISLVSHQGLTLTLFMIGSSLSVKTLKEVGAKPLILGIILWLLIAAMTLSVIILL